MNAPPKEPVDVVCKYCLGQYTRRTLNQAEEWRRPLRMGRDANVKKFKGRRKLT